MFEARNVLPGTAGRIIKYLRVFNIPEGPPARGKEIRMPHLLFSSADISTPFSSAFPSRHWRNLSRLSPRPADAYANSHSPKFIYEKEVCRFDYNRFAAFFAFSCMNAQSAVVCRLPLNARFVASPVSSRSMIPEFLNIYILVRMPDCLARGTMVSEEREQEFPTENTRHTFRRNVKIPRDLTRNRA